MGQREGEFSGARRGERAVWVKQAFIKFEPS